MDKCFAYWECRDLLGRYKHNIKRASFDIVLFFLKIRSCFQKVGKCKAFYQLFLDRTMMRKLSLDEIKAVQLQILDVVANFCEQHGIRYWLDCGTLIGAICHKGYIPWDDDVDIGMLRSDYDQFLALFNQNNDERYRCYSIENKKNFKYPFGKVLDTSTVLNEAGNILSINIDVFVYDNAPDDDKEVQRMFRRRCFCYFLQARHYSGKHQRRGRTFVRRLINDALWIALKIFPNCYFERKIVANSKRYSKKNTKRIGNFMGFKDAVWNKEEIFSSFIDVEFEGKTYKAPVGYDRWLRPIYGDYMQLPPEEERVTHHRFEAFIKETPKEK